MKKSQVRKPSAPGGLSSEKPSLDDIATAKLSQPGSALRRLKRLRAACQTQEIGAFYVRDTANIAWLTAFDGVFDEERAHSLLVTPSDALLHTDSRYSQALRRAISASGGPFVLDDRKLSFAQFLSDVFFTHGGQPDVSSSVLGIEDSISLAEYRELEAELAVGSSCSPCVRETRDFILNLRAVKDHSEIARLRAAQAITDAAFRHIVNFIRPGLTEREVQLELENYMLSHGASGLAFSSIVAAGENAASPHAVAGSTRLQAGQCVVLDFGARAHAYCSDMTRTIFLGEPSSRMSLAYKVMRQANEEVERAIKPGVTGASLQECAEQVLKCGGFGGTMGHALGHGVGIDIHEQPNLSPRNHGVLEIGNVVTVEPGIYLPGEFGMRLEDFGVVSDDGFEVFTASTHEMVII